MIKLLHTADWHLGQTFFGYDRTKEHGDFLNWLAEQISMHRIDGLLVAGDVFDVANPSALSQKMYYRFIQRVVSENPNLQLVVIAGNHDSAARLEAPIPLLETMRTEVRGVVRRTAEGKVDEDHLLVELKNREGETEVICLTVPYLRQGDCSVGESENGNTYAEGVRLFYQELLEKALERKKDDQAIVALGHLQAIGSEIAERDYSERTIIGGLECVSPEAFSESIVYTALGHIHKAQRVSGRENVRYAGSPLPMSFAEKHYRHGVMMLTIDQGRLTDLERLEYVPPVRLVSVPDGEALPPQEVLEKLSALPDVEGEPPYLEVKVLLEEPEPMFPNQVIEILEHKPYRLARIVPVYRQQSGEALSTEEVEGGLKEMNPLQIVQSVFERTYQCEMPNELVKLFEEACLSVVTANEEDEK